MHIIRSETVFGNRKPFKIDGKCVFTLKALFVCKIYNFLSWVFGLLEKWFDYKDKINFRIYDITTLERNNCNTDNAQYHKK